MTPCQPDAMVRRLTGMRSVHVVWLTAVALLAGCAIGSAEPNGAPVLSAVQVTTALHAGAATSVQASPPTRPLYFVRGRFLYRVTPGLRQTPLRIAKVGFNALSLVVRAGHIFWISEGGRAANYGFSIKRMTVQGKHVRVIVAHPGPATDLVVAAHHLYWSNDRAIARATLRGTHITVATSGCHPTRAGMSVTTWRATDGICICLTSSARRSAACR
jgi:hypothetical protein